MFIANSVEDVTGYSKYGTSIRGSRLLSWRVELNQQGQPVWKTHREVKTFWYGWFGWTPLSIKRQKTNFRKSGDSRFPIIATAAHNNLVTISEAAKLVDVAPPASLDRLTKILLEGKTRTIQNYLKPKPVKESKPEPEPKRPPTAVELAQRKLERARTLITEWQGARRNADKKAKEWSRKARRIEQRLARMKNGSRSIAEESQS